MKAPGALGPQLALIDPANPWKTGKRKVCKMKLHHVALCVLEIAPAIVVPDSLGATVTHQDETWALVDSKTPRLPLSAITAPDTLGVRVARC